MLFLTEEIDVCDTDLRSIISSMHSFLAAEHFLVNDLLIIMLDEPS
jgi:hypothetical protein